MTGIQKCLMTNLEEWTCYPFLIRSGEFEAKLIVNCIRPQCRRDQCLSIDMHRSRPATPFSNESNAHTKITSLTQKLLCLILCHIPNSISNPVFFSKILLKVPGIRLLFFISSHFYRHQWSIGKINYLPAVNSPTFISPLYLYLKYLIGPVFITLHDQKYREMLKIRHGI